jgi:hypothetical protein
VYEFAAAFTKGQAWFVWLVCASLMILIFTGVINPNVSGASVHYAIANGAISGAGLLSILILLGYRGGYLSKFVMLLTLIGVAALLFFIFWSRRPLMGLAVTQAAFVYRYKISWRSVLVRILFLGVLVVGTGSLLLFLGATRQMRFHGDAYRTEGVFSRENMENFMGCVTINYNVY